VKKKEEKEKGKVAHLFTVEMLSTVHFAEQWRRGSSKRKRRRRRRRKGRSRLCSALLLSFSGRLYLQKNRKQPDIPQTRERSSGAENPASKKNRGEEAALVNQPIPHHYLSSSSLKLLFANLQCKCKIVIGPINNNSYLIVIKQFIFVVCFKLRSSNKNKRFLNHKVQTLQVKTPSRRRTCIPIRISLPYSRARALRKN
jgi:hypothetical protein